jgi:membrane fusion protein, multidrug efflux system
MKKKKINVFMPLLFILGFSLINCSGDTGNSLSIADKAIPVETIKIKKGGIVSEAVYSGTIEESESQSLSFSTIGTVSKVLVSEGDHVRKGQLLATLDDATYRNTYEIMLAKMKQAEDAYKRLEPMYKNGTLPEIKMVEIETGLQEAKSSLAIAKKNMDDCKLYASTEGYIGKRSIDPGMSGTGSFMALTIVKIGKVFAKVSIPENEIAGIKVGQKATGTISAIGEGFTGSIEEIGVVGDIFAHTYKIKIGIQNNTLKIKPGMVCNVKLAYSKNDNIITVPSQAILIDNTGKNYVYLIDSNANKAVRRYIQIGKPTNNGIEIKQGLDENDLVVISGQQKLSEGSIIKISNK